MQVEVVVSLPATVCAAIRRLYADDRDDEITGGVYRVKLSDPMRRFNAEIAGLLSKIEVDDFLMRYCVTG